MKILVPIKDPKNNPYISEIFYQLKTQHQIFFDVKLFWGSSHFDIIHIHWPEELNDFQRLPRKKNAQIIQRINEWKAIGTKIIFTRHNIRSHKTRSYNILYKFLTNHSNYIIHLGNHSIQHFKSFQNHIVIDHHIYSSYPGKQDKKKAKKIMGINKNQFTIIVPGSLRFISELLKVYIILRNLSDQANLHILIQSWPKTFLYEKIKFPFIVLARHLLLQLFQFQFKNKITINKGHLKIETLCYWFSAADLALIPRFGKELNSGVVMLSLAYGIKVIGPQTGNITDILLESNNYPIKKWRFITKKINYLQSIASKSHPLSPNNILKKWSVATAVEKHMNLYNHIARINN